MNKVLIVTDLSFPKGSAMASRLLSFCHIFHDLGYSVDVITTKSEDEKNKWIDKGFYSYYVVNSNRSYGLQTLLGNENIKNAVDKYLDKNDVDFVFTTSLNMNFNRVYKTCIKHNKKIILEQCEWYDPSSFKFYQYDPRYINFNTNIKKRYLNVDGVISISRLLNDYYQSNDVKTIRIPSIVDIDEKKYNDDINNEKIHLIYTGNASRSKELLKPILLALNNNKYKDKFIFDIYGLTKQQLLNNINDETLLSDDVQCYGFIGQDKIEEKLLESDYQIFIRPNRRSSNAGFPTKLCESMSAGTPIITNDTGDIGLYLKDGYNGFVCKGNEEKDIEEVFDKILNLNRENYTNIRKNARKSAKDNFDYRNYLEIVKKLIEEI